MPTMGAEAVKLDSDTYTRTATRACVAITKNRRPVDERRPHAVE